MSDLRKFKDKHKGEILFIYGNSEELALLTPEQIKILEDNTSIGTNYSHEAVNSTYLMTGHQSHVLYAMEVRGVDNFDAVFFQSAKPNPIFKDKYDRVINLPCDPDRNISGNISNDNQRLGGCSNIGTSATHMAHILGASKVVYIGFNQKNLSHFYNLNETYKESIIENINKIREKYKNVYPQKLFDDYTALINYMKPLEVVRKTRWESNPHNINNRNIFNTMFNTMKDHGTEIYSTFKDSVMTEAGAEYKTLDEILKII